MIRVIRYKYDYLIQQYCNGEYVFRPLEGIARWNMDLLVKYKIL